MEERIWVKIDELQLHHLVPYVPLVTPKDETRLEKTVWASLKLGSAFDINGVLINSKSSEKASFTQGFGNADARLHDVPAWHTKPIKEELLDDVLSKAIHDFCLNHAKVLRPFIENAEPKDVLSFGPFKPEDWQGKSLMIPVDFVRLQNFNLVEKAGVVTADIQIGHHLIFWHFKVHDPVSLWNPISPSLHDAPLGEERIQDDKIRHLIGGMLVIDKDVKKTISAVAKGTIDMESKFIDKVEGCDPEATPPPIKFE